ncbi:MAG: MAPEG family protein [Acetobacteraceae bacterium]|nr:MAPEG family protein [Acetobacteraceae bacterium]
MTTPLFYLAATLVLALFQILLAAGFKRRQDGMEWAAGNREGGPERYEGAAGRLARAQANLWESLPIFIGAVLLAHVGGRDSALTAWGAGLFFWGRLIYVPVYGIGLTPWRSLVWGVALTGLILVLISLF